MPIAATPLRVLQVTDLHLKTQPGSRVWGVDVDAGLSAVLARIRERHPVVDFILVTGDLVGDEPDAYERVRQALEPLGAPVHCLPGNHDFPAALGQRLRDGLVRWQRHVIVGDWQFVLLDSSFPARLAVIWPPANWGCWTPRWPCIPNCMPWSACTITRFQPTPPGSTP